MKRQWVSRVKDIERLLIMLLLGIGDVAGQAHRGAACGLCTRECLKMQQWSPGRGQRLRRQH